MSTEEEETHETDPDLRADEALVAARRVIHRSYGEAGAWALQSLAYSAREVVGLLRTIAEGST